MMMMIMMMMMMMMMMPHLSRAEVSAEGKSNIVNIPSLEPPHAYSYHHHHRHHHHRRRRRHHHRGQD